MSLVVFPFKREDPGNLLKNVKIASAHPRVEEVLCVGFEEDDCFRTLAAAAPKLSKEQGKPVKVMVQERLGELRPGKGDGMNTALRYFLEETDHQRLHFYDADIVSFSEEWITKAEEAADQGYDVVRHYFPRASTDAMITWFITRTGFALLWPKSVLPWIEQPLGGELLLTREAARGLLADPRVRRQSDWGIDTLYTFSMVKQGFSLYETYMGVGKLHKLYGALTDLKTMLVECFAAIQSLRGIELTELSTHQVEFPGPVPPEVKEKLGYDLEGTLPLLCRDWTPEEEDLLALFPPEVRAGMEACRSFPKFSFMDEEAWRGAYEVLLDNFQLGQPHWESLLFRLWVARTLNYTAQHALRGYDHALYYLHQMIWRYARLGLRR
jgi:mannosylglycerate synthase